MTTWKHTQLPVVVFAATDHIASATATAAATTEADAVTLYLKPQSYLKSIYQQNVQNAIEIPKGQQNRYQTTN